MTVRLGVCILLLLQRLQICNIDKTAPFATAVLRGSVSILAQLALHECRECRTQLQVHCIQQTTQHMLYKNGLIVYGDMFMCPGWM